MLPNTAKMLVNFFLTKVLGIKGLDKVEGNTANNPIKLLEDK
jgi:hypothetical protein